MPSTRNGDLIVLEDSLKGEQEYGKSQFRTGGCWGS